MKKILACIFVVLFLTFLASCEGFDDFLHTHEYASEWKTDDSYHWHECSCGLRQSYAAHEYQWVTKSDATCTTAKVEEGTCICGKKVERTGDVPSGHNYSEDWSTDATSHWHDCSNCDEKSSLGEHVWNEGVVIETPTEEKDGKKEFTCTECGFSREETIAKLEHTHSFGEWEVVSASTAASEGLEERSCACDAKETRKVLTIPTLICENGILSWGEVANATGYKVYANDEVLSDVGDQLIYQIPNLSTEGIIYSVMAYTNVGGYKEESTKSNSCKVSVTYGENNLSKGDFESTTVDTVIPNDCVWYNGFLNNHTGSTKVINVNGNYVCEMRPNEYNNNVILTLPVGSSTIMAGTYRVYLDVYKGNAADGELFLGICDANLWHFGNVTVEVPEANESGWSKVVYEYTITNGTTGDWANFDLGYRSPTLDENDYIYVDNFKIVKIKGDTETRVDIALQGDFELFGSDYLLTESDWKANHTIFVEASSLENKLIVEDGNTYLKAYTTSNALVEFDLFADDAFNQNGTYLVTMKVKLGADSNVTNIGFRFWGDPRPTSSDYQFNVEGINSNDWTTVSAYVTINDFTDPLWVNMFFWVFTDNNVVNSVENYVLIDDISIQLQTVVVE